ncbi:MAG: DEAD/DEAH box helicase [Rikenellaceae bacterium]
MNVARTSTSFDLLAEPIQRWIESQGWSGLNDIQENSIPVILRANCDVIVSANTAGGKTEAVFLPILSSLLKNEIDVGYGVLYISPLKALINDQYRRLADITQATDIDIIAWHGDISVSQKKKSVANPKGVIIITPESLESFLINRINDLEKAFSSTRYVVIDELHSFIGTERGKQLQSLLSRIEIIIGRKIPRIAMSATFSEYESVEYFLRNDKALPCKKLLQNDSKHEVKLLIKDYVETKDYDPTTDIVDELYKLRGSNNLVFPNTKSDVEKLTLALSDKCANNNVPNEFRVHHGNLSKVERERVEKELQDGKYPITAICTSTLELGVDIGKVETITQLGKALSVASIRQRLGRSGRRGNPSYLTMLCQERIVALLQYDLRANLVHNIAVVELMMKKIYENPSINKYHFSTLIHQILSLLAQYGSFMAKDGWSILCENGAFRNVTPSIFLELLKALGKKGVISQLSSGQIVIGKYGENIVGRIDFYVVFTTPFEFDVVNKATSKRLGSIVPNPKLSTGSAIIIAGRRWIIDSINMQSKIFYVSNADNGGRTLFGGESIEVDRIIAKQMRNIYLSDTNYTYLSKNTETDKQLQIGRKFFHNNKLHQSNFFVYGKTQYFATWAGNKINRAISLIVKLYLNKGVSSDYLFVYDISKSEIVKVASKKKPTYEQLTVFVERSEKDKQKFDYLLSDMLLDLEYANTYLDIDGAWDILTQYKPIE